jgi:hypothetical protein
MPWASSVAFIAGSAFATSENTCLSATTGTMTAVANEVQISQGSRRAQWRLRRRRKRAHRCIAMQIGRSSRSTRQL